MERLSKVDCGLQLKPSGGRSHGFPCEFRRRAKRVSGFLKLARSELNQPECYSCASASFYRGALIGKLDRILRVFIAHLGLIPLKHNERERSQCFALTGGVSSAQLAALEGELLRALETFQSYYRSCHFD